MIRRYWASEAFPMVMGGELRGILLSAKQSRIGSLLLIGALALVIIGFILLPVVGFLLAVPVAALGIYFIRVHLNDKCEIESP